MVTRRSQLHRQGRGRDRRRGRSAEVPRGHVGPAPPLRAPPRRSASTSPTESRPTPTDDQRGTGDLRSTNCTQVGWLWTKHHILLGPRRYFTSDPPLVELSPCSKDGQGEGESADIAHQPISQGIEPGTTESVDREQSPEPPAPQLHTVGNDYIHRPNSTPRQHDPRRRPCLISYYWRGRCERPPDW